jgi:peptidoglycan/xylan/chitin deacetylase (PgdA/CDA1 family)
VTHLCFHGIGAVPPRLTSGEQEYWTPTGLFHRILDLVAARDDVTISFDDGYASDVEIGLPALLDRGVRATFFPSLGPLGRSGRIAEEGVIALRDAGMDLGVHGIIHEPWTGYRATELVRELEEARAFLHNLSGLSIAKAACPLGAYDKGVLSVLRRTGFTRVYTSDRVQARPDAWVQPRFSIRCHDDLESVIRMIDPPGSLRASARGVALLAYRRSV